MHGGERAGPESWARQKWLRRGLCSAAPGPRPGLCSLSRAPGANLPTLRAPVATTGLGHRHLPSWTASSWGDTRCPADCLGERCLPSILLPSGTAWSTLSPWQGVLSRPVVPGAPCPCGVGAVTPELAGSPLTCPPVAGGASARSGVGRRGQTWPRCTSAAGFPLLGAREPVFLRFRPRWRPVSEVTGDGDSHQRGRGRAGGGEKGSGLCP